MLSDATRDRQQDARGSGRSNYFPPYLIYHPLLEFFFFFFFFFFLPTEGEGFFFFFPGWSEW